MSKNKSIKENEEKKELKEKEELEEKKVSEEIKENEENQNSNFFDSLIQAKEDGDSFIIDKKKNEELSNVKSTYKTAVYAYIDNALNGEHKNALKALLDKAFEASDVCKDNENKQCYLTGMKDCIKLYTSLFGKDISG